MRKGLTRLGPVQRGNAQRVLAECLVVAQRLHQRPEIERRGRDAARVKERVTIEGNHIHDNTAAWVGISLDGATAIIRNNIMSHNSGGNSNYSFSAINVSDSHGSPDLPDSPDNLFLLPYNTRYDDIATTGFPMWDIETALKRFVKARKVIVIADACHSGGVGSAFDIAAGSGRGIKVNPISAGLQDLSKVGDGVYVISASDDRQLSQESKYWGGGHGVFTHFLIKGLKGEADYNKDKRVSLGEIIPYLSEQVRRATRNAQTPTVAGRFDPALCIGK